jgi:hypothetical protein
MVVRDLAKDRRPDHEFVDVDPALDVGIRRVVLVLARVLPFVQYV